MRLFVERQFVERTIRRKGLFVESTIRRKGLFVESTIRKKFYKIIYISYMLSFVNVLD